MSIITEKIATMVVMEKMAVSAERIADATAKRIARISGAGSKVQKGLLKSRTLNQLAKMERFRGSGQANSGMIDSLRTIVLEGPGRGRDASKAIGAAIATQAQKGNKKGVKILSQMAERGRLGQPGSGLGM